jgi:hypothetical protein
MAFMLLLGFFYSCAVVFAYQNTLVIQYMTIPPNISCMSVGENYGE